MAYADQARQAGDAVFGGKKLNINTQTQQNNAAAQAALQALQQWGQTGAGEINASYEGLLGDLGRNRDATRTLLQDQVGRSAQGYSDAANANLAVRDEGRKYLEGLAGSLGFGGQALGEISQGTEGLAAKLNERNQRWGQDQQTMLGNWATQHDTFYGDQMVNARGAQAQSQSEFANQIAAALAEREKERVEREIQLQMALSELMGQQGQFELGYAGQLVDRDTKVAMQQAELQAAAQRQAAQMALEREKMASSQGSDALDWAKFQYMQGQDAQDQRNWEAEFARSGQKAPRDYSGLEGAKRYVQDQGLDPSLVSTARDRLNPFISNPDIIDPVAAAVSTYNPPTSTRAQAPGYVQNSLPQGWWGGMTKDQFAELASILMGEYY